MATFEIKDLSFTYPGQTIPSLSHISLEVWPGEFIVLCGKSGCGKTTLLRHLKSALTPYGEREGAVLFEGAYLDGVSDRDQAAKIGYVLQSPENQIVTDKVWHELAFGMESLGFDTPTIRLRVAEMASFFGIQDWFMRDVAELSGGQKQLLNLASIMAMQPTALILDEPTSQLDPIAASDFLETVKRINRELGTTVILTEHRLEEVFPASDRVAVMDKGEIIVCDTPQNAGRILREEHSELFESMPAPMQIYAQVGHNGCPLTVKEGRLWLSYVFKDGAPSITKVEDDEAERELERKKRESAIKLEDVWFRYEKDSPDVLKGLNLDVKRGEFACIVGGNGTGKSTALAVITGIHRPYRGKTEILGRDPRRYSDRERFENFLGVLPQNPQTLFVKKTVHEDLMEVLDRSSLSTEEKEQKILSISEQVQITSVLKAHPYDLSGGEQQRAALAKVLLLGPKILLMDEPTKGLDNFFKITFAEIIKGLQAEGVTVLMVSHDIEFCARHADRCMMFFDGGIVTENPPRAFFTGNSFYTTSANRMSRHIFENAMTAEDVVLLCKENGR